MSEAGGAETRYGRGGSRLAVERLPDAVRRWVEAELGAPIRSGVSQPGGFSPGVAARLLLEDGRRAFLKAAGSVPNATTPRLHRSEARIAGALPPSLLTPRLLASYDDGDWVALLFEDVAGAPPELPWRRDQLERVLSALTELSASLTPSPVEAPPVAQRLGEVFRGWRRLAAGDQDAGRLDGWSRRHLDRLAELEAGWATAAAGEALLHLDIRADNLLLTEDRVVVVDWPHAGVGAAWVDLVCLLPSVTMQGGPAPWEVFDPHPLTRRTAPEAVVSVVAALAGYMVFGSLLPPSPGLPTIREFQRLQAAESLAWLRHLTGWT